MAIERINKIKNHRIFSGFAWPQDLLDFKEKNLFYGWNGTGKSTLSNLLRSIEKQAPISEGQVEFVIDGNKVDGANLTTAQGLPQVRVFNKGFIADNVFTSHGAVAPIFFLGEENIEKQKQVEKLKGDIDLAEKEGREKEAEKRRLEKTLDDFKKERAKSIKDLLSSSGGNNPYNNYDKRSYQVKCDELLKLSDAEQTAKVLDESDLDAQKKNEIDTASTALQAASDKSISLKTEVREIEKDIEEHRRPADELNTDICSYLGRDELTFEIQGTGYQISRNGNPAENLSEGERTAIAFLYFLKSLGDKSFSLRDGIVVIDDPVSSLDSNALFHAFGFMKDRTKDAGQLFILTHSHSFFRQVKNWFNHLPNQKKRTSM